MKKLVKLILSNLGVISDATITVAKNNGHSIGDAMRGDYQSGYDYKYAIAYRKEDGQPVGYMALMAYTDIGECLYYVAMHIVVREDIRISEFVSMLDEYEIIQTGPFRGSIIYTADKSVKYNEEVEPASDDEDIAM